MQEDEPIQIDYYPESFETLPQENADFSTNDMGNDEPIQIDYYPKTFEPLNPSDTNNKELSYGERAAQFASGLANIPATAVDLTNQYIASPVLNATGGALQLAGKGASYVSEDAGQFLENKAQDAYKARDFYGNSNVSEKVAESFNKAAEKDITPKDTIGKILHMTGEFSFPLSNVAKGAKTVSQGAKAITKHLAGAAGGATAVEEGKNYKYFKDDSVGGHVEDFLHAVVGMTIADKGLSGAKKIIVNDIGKDLSKYIKDEGIIEGLKQGATNAIAKPYSKFANPKKIINKLAKQEGIDLPFQVKLGGKFNAFLANTYLKSLFTNKVYDTVIEKADTDMINAVKNKINQINPEQATGDSASLRAADFLQQDAKNTKEVVRKLYDESNSKITEKDAIKPVNTFKAMHDIFPKIKAASPSKDMTFVANKLKKIGEEWGFLPNLEKYANTTEDNSNLIKILQKEWNNKNIKDISLEDLDIQIKALKNDIKYEKDIPGVKNFLNGLIGAMEKDLASSQNKEFVKSRAIANKYFKQNIADRIRTNMASSLMNGERPTEAYKYMGKAKDIRFLQKVLGESKAASEVLSSLKRAKLEEIFQDNILFRDGTINYGSFSNLFSHQPEKQALLKELLGEQYQGVKDLSQIAQGFADSGKLFGNPSKTTLSARDVQGVKEAIVYAGRLLFSGGALASGATTLGISDPAMVYASSYLLSNKRFVNTVLKYAEARSPESKTVLKNRIQKIVKQIGSSIEKRPSSLITLEEDHNQTKNEKSLLQNKEILNKK